MVLFFQKIIDILDQHNIPYMLSGSIAMGLYVVPRMTRDIDFVIHLEPKNLDAFVDSFKEGFYCDRDVVKEAIETSFKMFNIIDHATGYKADFIVLKNEAFRQEEFKRKIQMEDIRNLAALDRLDWEYVLEWVNQLKLRTFDLLK